MSSPLLLIYDDLRTIWAACTVNLKSGLLRLFE
jgi:hypothetical protein